MIKHLDHMRYEPFHIAFKEYFDELGVAVNDWDALFQTFKESTDDEVLIIEKENKVIAFLNFRVDTLDHWFFTVPFLFVRELWVSKAHRSKGLAHQLLSEVEVIAQSRNVHQCVLTTSTARGYYEKQGYHHSHAYIARNEDEVMIKEL